ncbi:SRPBCC family protein [Streptomyces sp. NPDC051940]|uniref:SRPBCC family protein n=1 Tax=Streptomyces sp. NPDC051940 TaxID=3155675 RepID=UPI003412E6E6
MAHLLRPVPLGFADDAPLRLVFTGELAAPADAVQRALARDTEGWADWFAAVRSARAFEGGRAISLRGGIRFTETVLADEEARRYAYRVDETNAPGLSALLEDWHTRPAPAGGTQVEWVWAADGPAPVRRLLRLARPGIARAFSGAMRALDRRLAQRAPGG